MKKKILAMMLAACTALADDVNGITYGGISIGAGWAKNLPSAAFDLNVDIGYYLNNYIAFEGAVSYMPSSQNGMNVSYTIVDIAAKGVLPVSDMISLDAKLGLGLGYSSITVPTYANSATNKFGVLTGVGAMFKVTDSVYITTDGYGFWPTSNNSGYGRALMLVGGIEYRFQ
jgi:hypothetical protein